MTPRLTELHIIGLEQSFLERGTATATCSCGTEHGVTGRDRAALWAAAYNWHAEHRLAAAE